MGEVDKGVAFDFSRGWPEVFAPRQPDRDMTLEVWVNLQPCGSVQVPTRVWCQSCRVGLRSPPITCQPGAWRNLILCNHEALPASPSMTRSCTTQS